MMKNFALVEYVDEDNVVGIAAVKWLFDNEKRLYYPNSLTSDEEFTELVKAQAEPDTENWNVENVKVLKKYATYAEARLGLPRAEKHSDLESSDLENPRPRKRKPPNTFMFPGDSSEEDSVSVEEITRRSALKVNLGQNQKVVDKKAATEKKAMGRKAATEKKVTIGKKATCEKAGTYYQSKVDKVSKPPPPPQCGDSGNNVIRDQHDQDRGDLGNESEETQFSGFIGGGQLNDRNSSRYQNNDGGQSSEEFLNLEDMQTKSPWPQNAIHKLNYLQTCADAHTSKLSEISETVNSLVQYVKNERKMKAMEEKQELHFVQKLPYATLNAFEEFDSKIAASLSFRLRIKTLFLTLFENGVKNSVQNIMRKLLMDELALDFCLSGKAEGKIPFNVTNSYSIILELFAPNHDQAKAAAAQGGPSTKTLTNTAISDWLTQAKHRISKRQQRLAIKEVNLRNDHPGPNEQG